MAELHLAAQEILDLEDTQHSLGEWVAGIDRLTAAVQTAAPSPLRTASEALLTILEHNHSLHERCAGFALLREAVDPSKPAFLTTFLGADATMPTDIESVGQAIIARKTHRA